MIAVSIYAAAYFGFGKYVFALLPAILVFWAVDWGMRYYRGELSIYRGTWLLTPVPRDQLINETEHETI